MLVGDPAPARGRGTFARIRRQRPKPTRSPAAARVRKREYRLPDRGRSVGPRDRRHAGGVDRDHGDVAVDIDAGDRALGCTAVAEDDRARLAPYVVGVRQHFPSAATTPLPEAREADDRGTDLLCDPLDAGLEFV